MDFIQNIQNGIRYNTKKLNDLCQQLSQEELFFQPYGNVNHLVWQLGHLMFTRNTIIKLLNDEPLLVLPTERQLFGPKCKIETPDSYPALEELLGEFERRGTRIVELAGNVSPERLSAESFLKVPSFGITYAEQLQFFYIHECNHLGEINVLRNIVTKNREILFA